MNKQLIRSFVFCYLLSISFIAFSAPIVVTLVYHDAKNELTVSYPQSGAVEVRKISSHRINLQFKDMIEFAKNSETDVSPFMVSNGYDSLTISTLQGSRVSFSQSKHQVSLSIKGVEDIKEQPSLELVYLRYFLIEGKYKQAQDLMEALKRKHPKNLSVWLQASNIYGAFGFPLQSLSNIEAALSLDPKDIDAKKAKKDLLINDRLSYLGQPVLEDKGISNWVEYGLAYQRQGASLSQLLGSIKYTHALNDKFRIGFKGLGQWLDAKVLKEPYLGNSVSRSKIYPSFSLFAQYLPDEYNTYTAKLYSSFQNVLGFGVSMNQKFTAGNYELVADYKKPTTDIPEAYAFGGNLSQIGINSFYNYKYRVSFSASAYLQQFGYRNQANAAQALHLFFNTTYGLSNRLAFLNFSKPYGQFDLSYSVDGQYLGSLHHPINPSTGLPEGLALFTFEIHTLELSWRKSYNYHWDETLLYIGPSYNRYGGQIGFIIGGHIQYRFTDNLLARLYASRSLSGTFQGQFNDEVGLTLSHFF